MPLTIAPGSNIQKLIAICIRKPGKAKRQDNRNQDKRSRSSDIFFFSNKAHCFMPPPFIYHFSKRPALYCPSGILP